MTRNELIQLARKIIQPEKGTSEEEHCKLVEQFDAEVPHPAASDLFFYPDYWGLKADASPEAIVEKALSWTPSLVSALIIQWHGHPKRRDLRCYEINVPGILHSQAISKSIYKAGTCCAVATSGYLLRNGVRVAHRFIDNAYSLGEILGVTSESVGRELSEVDFTLEGLPTV